MVDRVRLQMNHHTKAKHTILERYLKGWFPILSRWNGRIIYLDGFAGSGIYDSGDPGSPVIALKVANEHTLHDMIQRGEKVFYFVEKDRDTYLSLRSVLDDNFGPWEGDNKLSSLPGNFKVFVSEGDFNKEIDELLNDLERSKNNLAPTFAFVDPYGYSLDLKNLSRIVAYPKCEVLFTFMVGFLDRFVFADEHLDVIKNTFGVDNDKIRDLRSISDEKAREEAFGDLLIRILKERLHEPDSLYWLSFKMIDRHNRTLYWLVYFTKSLRGMEVMKDSMFEIGRRGDYMFSDFYFDPSQRSILDYSEGTEMWVRNAADFLQQHLTGYELNIEAVRKYVTLSSPFIYRAKILCELERRNKIRVKYDGLRRTCTYPIGSVIVFL